MTAPPTEPAEPTEAGPNEAEPTGPVFVPVPTVGRTFTAARRVRWGDTDVARRLRLDALARYLQDVANDDTRDAGHDPMAPWVVRRTTVRVLAPVALGEQVSLTTFSGGHGSRWAERRTVVAGADGGHVEAAALWVYVDAVTGRPAKLTAEFHTTYDEAAGGREVGARLRHAPPPDGADTRPWPLRATDLDGLGHVNNAVAWAAVQDELARRGLTARDAEVEYPDAIAPDAAVDLVSEVVADRLRLWLVVGGRVRASAVARTRPDR